MGVKDSVERSESRNATTSNSRPEGDPNRNGVGIEARGLSRRFGRHTALDRLDLSIPPNTVYNHPTKAGHTVFTYVFEGKGYFCGSTHPENVARLAANALAPT